MRFASLKVAVIAALVASPVCADATTPFVDVLSKNWSAFDADKDGTLVEDEINAALKNPAIQGDAAAALAAVKLVHRANKKDLPPLTQAYFADYAVRVQGKLKPAKDGERDSAAPSTDENGEVVATEGKLYNFDRTFGLAQKRIAKNAGQQWRGVYNRDNLSQGPLGDCFFVASVGSAVTHRPALIKELVQRMPDGSYRATFPGGEPFTFAPLTESQLGISSTTNGDGGWMAVLEMAYGKHRSRLRGGSLDVEGTDILRTGGDSAVTLQALTGNKTNRISFPKAASERREKQDEFLARLRVALKESLASERIITCGVVPPRAKKVDENDAQAVAAEAARMKDIPARPKGIQVNHVYAIVSFDEKTDTVEVWNPHGQTFDPKGEAGLVNGYVTRQGKFRLPLAEAYMIYSSFTFETATPKSTKEEKPDNATAENR